MPTLERDVSATCVVFCPSYDDLTRSLYALTTELRKDFLIIGGDDVVRGSFLNAATREAENSIVVFMGHGTNKFLLTSPVVSERVIVLRNRRHGCLIEVDDLQLWSGKSLFAYACWFGEGVAEAVLPETTKIVGYKGEIPFVKIKGSIDSIFLSPVRAVLGECLQRKNFLRRGGAIVRREYSDRIRELRSGDNAKDKHKRSLRLALMYHRELLTEAPRGGEA